jgi:enoyl-[acyl-carrier protein] reductase II
MIQTKVCELLQIEYPIFQGGMAWISDGDLAAAVSNGGGLGIIAAMSMDGETLRREIRRTRTLTSKPFGVNIMLMSPHVAEVAHIVIEEQVPVLTTGAGNPAKYMKDWLAAGIQVLPVIASVAMAKLAMRAGATALIAEGCESGGHVGELTTMALVPQVCDIADIPVIAAGGIADGRGAAAVFMLGAEGLQLGTRFLLAAECNVHANYKNLVLKAKDIDTITTGKRLGHPVRSLKTPFSRNYFKAEYDTKITDEQLENLGVGALRLAAIEGDTQNGCFPAGQIAGLVHKEQPAAEIIREIFIDMERVLMEAQQWIKQ